MKQRTPALVAIAMLGLMGTCRADNPKPPASEYDAVRDVTGWSTGTMRANGHTHLVIMAIFHGKAAPAQPEKVLIQFNTWHTNDQGATSDLDGCVWEQLKNVAIRVGDKSQTFDIAPNSYTHKAETSSVLAVLAGRVVHETLLVEVPWDFVKSMTADDSVYEVGTIQGSVKGRQRDQVKKLVAAFG